MKKLFLILSLLLSISVQAQTQYDYMDDNAVAGGADRAFNGIVILLLIVIALFVIVFIIGGIAKIKYQFSPQKEIDRQKREKEKRERQEQIRKEQEHLKALLALPKKTIRLQIKGKPHLVMLGRFRLESEMIAICLWSVDKVIWNGNDITDQVGSEDKHLNYIYEKYYQSQYDDSCVRELRELIVSEYCAKLADKYSITTFEIEFTIRGDFNPQKLQIIHHIHEGLKHERIKRDIKCLEFVLYDGDEIRTHLTNGKPLCVVNKGYSSYPKF